MLENATRVCGANFGTMNLYDGDSFHNVAFYNVPPAFASFASRRVSGLIPRAACGTAVRTKQAVQFDDLEDARGLS